MRVSFEAAVMMLEYGDERRLSLNAYPGEDISDFPQRLALDDPGAMTPALALTPCDERRALLAYAYATDDSPRCQYLLFPYAMLAADLPLERLVEALPLEDDDLLTLTAPAALGDKTASVAPPQYQPELLLTMLGALLNADELQILNFPPIFAKRMRLILALRKLLPGSIAASLGFATAGSTGSQKPQLQFADGDADAAKSVIDWAGGATIRAPGAHPYVDLLRAFKSSDHGDFMARIRALDSLAAPPPIQDLSSELARIANRYLLDQQLQASTDIDSPAILHVLNSPAPPTGKLRRLYYKRLLENALRDRDAAAGKRVAEALDADPTLADELDAIFVDMLDTQPDAVYVFIRNRLNHLGIDAGWIPRLQAAARASLDVALEEGDVPTLISWLELFAHEPLRYQLQEILRDGVLAARERAHENGELGIHLILIAARRLPAIADQLYADAALIAALPAKISRALRENSAEALEPLIDETAEYFLLALFHGIHTAGSQFVTARPVRYLWSLFNSNQRVNLPVIYRPPAMIRELATKASGLLTDDALQVHLTQIIKNDDRELFSDAASLLADREALFPWLGALLEEDSLSLEQVLWVLNAAGSLENVAAADVIDASFGLLDYYEWSPETLPMMEALARLMGKTKALNLSYRRLWRLYESCNAQQTETAARVAINHLLRQFASDDDLSLVVNGVARICHSNKWSGALQDSLNNWWRDYSHGSSLVRLQRLERELETQRNLDEQRQILRTALAMRRWIPQGDPVKFADGINAACAMVEHLSEAFDLAQLTDIDPLTVRRELDEIGGNLSADERHILANNLRHLAQVITQMAEKRSKPSFIRSDDSIDRQLMRGEANPQGSIDMMKWIAGYLGGSHQINGD